jgi:hypothetical protein
MEQQLGWIQPSISIVMDVQWKILIELYSRLWANEDCEEFLHIFHMKICAHKTHLGVELLCSCILTS